MALNNWTKEEKLWLKNNANKYFSMPKLQSAFNNKFNSNKTLYSLRRILRKLNISPQYGNKQVKSTVEKIIANNIHKSTSELIELVYEETGIKFTERRLRRHRQVISQWDEEKARIKVSLRKDAKDGKRYYCSVPATHYIYNKVFPYRCHNNSNDRTGKKSISVPRATFNWILVGNSIPDKHILIHLDGDSTNDDINNLRCISRRELTKLMLFLGDGGNRFANVGTLRYPPGFIDSVLEMIKFDDKVKQI